MAIDKISINFKKKSASLNVGGLFFNDHGHFILYLPALELTSYGDNKKEALELMNTIVKDYLKELINRPEAEVVQELTKYGWKRNQYFKKKFESNTYIDKEGILKNFNLPADTTLIEETKLEAAA